MTGASTGKSLDGALAKADAVLFRTPYQNDPDLRKSINEGRTRFLRHAPFHARRRPFATAFSARCTGRSSKPAT